MKSKEKIFDFSQRHVHLMKLYKGISYIKNKIIIGIKYAYPIMKYKRKYKKSVFLAFTPEHANLGDHAIAYAEELLLRRNNIEYFEITGKVLYELYDYKYLKLLDNTFVLVNGGGNLGTLWPEIELMNRRIISCLPQATIFVLPNSIYYGDSERDKLEFEYSKQIYNGHRNLYLYARENLSYQVMKRAYKNVKLVPDMVLSLNEERKTRRNHKCLLCLRNDIERTLSHEDEETILSELYEMFDGQVQRSSTVLDHSVSVSERWGELEKIFDLFSSVELVVTDRLHGMIFSAITGTKCVVISGKSPKIVGCFEWIKELSYIQLVESPKQLCLAYEKMPPYPCIYNNEVILACMDELENDILHIYDKL